MAPHALTDNHGRTLDYLRLAVTDRCNLRCFYCMPEEGIRYLPKSELLTYEEIDRLVHILAGAGIRKIRITGGEPFVRNDLMQLLTRLTDIQGVQSLHLTTNGVLTAPHIPALKELGIASVNLSMDTLDPARFRAITRRDEFDKVQETFHLLLEHQMPLKINAVVMEGKNIDDLLPLAELTHHLPVEVRFIEEMPFNGAGSHYPVLSWTHRRIHQYLTDHFGPLTPITDSPGATASLYRIPGYTGTVGIIAAFSRTFCGTCNRLRITARGDLKTCLYDDGVLSLKDLLRKSVSDAELLNAIRQATGNRAVDGRAAEARRHAHLVTESMSTIGG